MFYWEIFAMIQYFCTHLKMSQTDPSKTKPELLTKRKIEWASLRRRILDHPCWTSWRQYFAFGFHWSTWAWSSEIHRYFLFKLYLSILFRTLKSLVSWRDSKYETYSSYSTRLCISSCHGTSAKTTRFTNRKLIKAKHNKNSNAD